MLKINHNFAEEEKMYKGCGKVVNVRANLVYWVQIQTAEVSMKVKIYH